MIQISEESPIVLSVPIVRLGNSRAITLYKQWGLGIVTGDILTIKIKCDDGEERYLTQSIKVKQRSLRITVPPSWNVTPGNVYDMRIIKYIPQEGGAD